MKSTQHIHEKMESAFRESKERKDNSPISKAIKKSYSPKMARAGKDIGEKGKNFSKIERKASKEYGSKEAGARVAGAVLAKLRNK